jgi:hypothetical protein
MTRTVITLVALGITIYLFGMMSPVLGSGSHCCPVIPRKQALPAIDTQRFNPAIPGGIGERLRQDAQKYGKVPPPEKSGGKMKNDTNSEPESVEDP